MVCLYLHIPFCQKKCNYCSFSSGVAGSEVFTQYITALKQELSDLAATRDDRHLKSLFVGGGTPSILPFSMLTDLIGYCLTLFNPTSLLEITVEVNPGTVDEEYLRALLVAGVNRISMGVQTFSDQELSILGRTHSSIEACYAVQAAKDVGFININLDLMYGLPGQTVESWRKSLQQAIALNPQHLSVYQLTIEGETPLGRAVASGEIVLPEEEKILHMDEEIRRFCCDAGLRQYEISAFASDGYECVHNINYWQNNDYLACGTSAVSCVGGVREKRITDTLEYIGCIKKGVSVVCESECLSAEASFRESVILGLRMTKGVSLHRLTARYEIDLVKHYGAVLDNLCKLQLVELTDSHLRLTAKGRPLANWVMVELV
ncbi:MAG: radical SAM family heme chaperone HemW [Proteobacteria bacterium]|nr:radical SAM family heme chaperone HemW [Pseudomonadota bacterium]